MRPPPGCRQRARFGTIRAKHVTGATTEDYLYGPDPAAAHAGLGCFAALLDLQRHREKVAALYEALAIAEQSGDGYWKIEGLRMKIQYERDNMGDALVQSTLQCAGIGAIPNSGNSAR